MTSNAKSDIKTTASKCTSGVIRCRPQTVINRWSHNNSSTRLHCVLFTSCFSCVSSLCVHAFECVRVVPVNSTFGYTSPSPPTAPPKPPPAIPQASAICRVRRRRCTSTKDACVAFGTPATNLPDVLLEFENGPSSVTFVRCDPANEEKKDGQKLSIKIVIYQSRKKS